MTSSFGGLTIRGRVCGVVVGRAKARGKIESTSASASLFMEGAPSVSQARGFRRGARGLSCEGPALCPRCNSDYCLCARRRARPVPVEGDGVFFPVRRETGCETVQRRHHFVAAL